ncbi:MAG: DUF1569 domain-containing protein [Flavobacteriaceae bacterium]
MTKSTVSYSSFLSEQLNEIATHIPNRDSFNLKVSKVPVAWHLDHSLKTINSIFRAMESSDPELFRSNFSVSRFFVYAYGDFPRGYAKAPRLVLPPDNITTKSLYRQLEEAKVNSSKLEYLHTKSHFKHPYFNVIDKDQSKRFLKIHTRHHLKIVRDILK